MSNSDAPVNRILDAFADEMKRGGIMPKDANLREWLDLRSPNQAVATSVFKAIINKQANGAYNVTEDLTPFAEVSKGFDPIFLRETTGAELNPLLNMVIDKNPELEQSAGKSAVGRLAAVRGGSQQQGGTGYVP